MGGCCLSVCLCLIGWLVSLFGCCCFWFSFGVHCLFSSACQKVPALREAGEQSSSVGGHCLSAFVSLVGWTLLPADICYIEGVQKRSHYKIYLKSTACSFTALQTFSRQRIVPLRFCFDLFCLLVRDWLFWTKHVFRGQSFKVLF